MQSLHRLFLTVAFFFSALVSSPALAQDVQNFKPVAGTQGYFSVDGARSLDHLEFVPSLYLGYAFEPLVNRNQDGSVNQSIVENLFSLDLLANFGLFNRLDLALNIPLHYTTGTVIGADGEDGIHLGDLRFTPKVRLVGFDEGADTGVGLAFAVPVVAPTGRSEAFVGAGQLVVTPKFLLEVRTALISLAANLGFKARPDKKVVENTELGHEVTYGAGLGVSVVPDEFVLIAEVYGAAAVQDISSDSASNPFEGLAGFRWFSAPGVVWTTGFGLGIVADYGTPTWRVFTGLAWDPQERDRDRDGILDDVDQCPDDPEDKDDYQDLDGCPELDNDSDGLPDRVDACPLDPEDRDDYEDADGCPDPDNDGDTILDPRDQCPNQPETFNGFDDTDGCPDEGDRDQDGIPDARDQCPDDPEDKDGFEDENGCPDPDNDKDGILDGADKCPLEPEVVNGIEDEDGCPDKGEVKVRVTGDRIEILEKVFFESSRAVIKPVSYDVLNQVAAVLKRAPNITLVEVAGHTDSRGARGYNQTLSQRRAAAVRAYLLERGLEASRLRAKGYGEDQPIETNRTRDGRAANRRVEFRIIDQTKR